MTQQSDKTKEEILKGSEKFYDNKRVIKAALLAMEKYAEQEVGKANKIANKEVSHAYKVGRISGITKGVTVTGAIAIVIILTLILCL